MLLIIYNIVFYISFFIFLPFHTRRIIRKEKYKKGVLQRFGFIKKDNLKYLDTAKKNIWVHAVSVGEVLTAFSVLKELEKKYNNSYNLILSTTTLTGYNLAAKKKPAGTHLFFYPLDFYGATKRMLNSLNPSLIILIETEIWPNFISQASLKKIPLVIINGRISDKSYRRYLKTKFFFQKIINKIDAYGMQTEEDKQRILKIGAPKEKIEITGNIKIDNTRQLYFSEEDKNQFREEFKTKDNEYIIVAGSTHPGEEEILANIYLELKQEFPQLLLIIVPRHIERSEKINKMLHRKKLNTVLRTEKNYRPDMDILIVDTIGELAKFYSLATVVFIGKSLLPPGGGQNMLEPAALNKPILFGPHVNNFKQISDTLLKLKGAVLVKDEKSLKKNLRQLLLDWKLREEIGHKARKFLEMHKGALEKNLKLIEQFLITTTHSEGHEEKTKKR